MIIVVLDFKIDLIYLLQRENAPLKPRLVLLFLYTTATILVFVSPTFDSSYKVTDEQVERYNIATITTTLIVLSFCSIYYLVSLNRN